jgi:septum formation protein
MQFQQIFTVESPLILASESPQRADILTMMQIPFRTVKSDFPEILDPALSPAETAELFAKGKAESVARNFPNSFVVGVDTLVVSADGEILGKPKDETEARRMIAQKSGKMETVLSGICLVTPTQTLVRHETAEIHFAILTAEDVEWMLACNEWQGRSGAISVEGRSSVFIERINGNFWNIVGFPIPTFLKMLKQAVSSR